jgi:hypothetical protein
VLADGIREAFADLFAVNTKAHEFDAETAKNKLRTLYAGKKTDLVIDRIAKTFRALCDYADFSAAPAPRVPAQPSEEGDKKVTVQESSEQRPSHEESTTPPGKIKIAGLQYHINVVLPETRDQAVYDAIFRSLREHLG